jgi:hypothetical protein
MKTGEHKPKEVKKPGIFYVHEHNDWIVGGKITDERAHLNPSSVRPYQFAPVKQRRIF